MALQCQMAINSPSYSAGQTPPPAATLTIFNPNAVAVVVTGVELAFTDKLGQTVRPVIQPSVVPIGPGQPTSVPALGTVTLGPFPMTFGSAAASSSFAMVPPGAQPANVQGSQPPQVEINIGALVYASDGSVNVAGRARVLVSYTVSPPLGYQGGVAQFGGPNNANLVAAGVG